MGWTTLHDAPPSMEAFLRNAFHRPGAPEAGLVDYGVVEYRTAYAAVRDRSGHVGGRIILLDYAPFAYKIMDEDEGPLECRCPEHVLRRLSPPDTQHAREWRDRCWDRIRRLAANPNLTDGDVVRLDSPARYHGAEFRYFALRTERTPRGGVRRDWWALDVSPDGSLRLDLRVRMPKHWRERDFEKVGSILPGGERARARPEDCPAG